MSETTNRNLDKQIDLNSQILNQITLLSSKFDNLSQQIVELKMDVNSMKEVLNGADGVVTQVELLKEKVKTNSENVEKIQEQNVWLFRAALGGILSGFTAIIIAIVKYFIDHK